jgi:glycosyltransferase involved in cell wall biosynthesis
MITHLIPVFNTESHHLIECIQSIRSQDSSPILIIDDGSTKPETSGALQLIELTIPNVTVQRLPENIGTPAALNIGHALIDTEYIALMGSSDIALPGKYAVQIEALKKFPKIDVIGTGLMAFKDSDPYRKQIFGFTHTNQPTPGYLPKHHKYFIVNHGTVIYRNDAVKAVGGYNETYRRAQDVELWSRMYENGACFRNIEKIYYLWRR